MKFSHSTSRRNFLRGTAGVAASLTLELSHLRPLYAATDMPKLPPEAKAYKGYRDVYRKKWSWDRVGIGTHTCTNCVSGGCSWNLYVKDDIVWREEQGAPYIQTNAEVPDYNPRGCQKGGAASALYRSAARLRYPLKRVGARGENRWKRISWDEALNEVTTALVDVLSTRGGSGVLTEGGTNNDFGPSSLAMRRFLRLLGIPLTNIFASIGDLPNAATEVLGMPMTGGSSDDWFRTDYFVNWCCNPMVTRMPDAHFITEARYRGAKIVSVTPDFNASAMHADLWLTLRPGTDAALALAACRVVIDEQLYDREYILEQTDLPLLVRTDTRQFLNEADVVPGGRQHCHAWWDEKRQQIVWSASSMAQKQRTLKLGPEDHPALEPKNLMVTLVSGQQVAVRTVFSALRQTLAASDLESAAQITGVHATVIERFAREFAGAKSAMIYCGAGLFKNYHGDLATRAQILLCALTGNNGRAGGGWHYMTMFEMEGEKFVAFAEHPTELSLDRPEGLEKASAEIGREQSKTPLAISGLFVNLFYVGMRDDQMKPAYGDPTLPRTPEAYLAEAIAEGNFPNLPSGDNANPDLIFNVMGNPFRNSRMGDRREHTLYKTAKLVVDITIRMDDTARFSDILLPAASAYEKIGFKYSTSYPPYLHMSDRTVAPLGESKPEWEIFSLLAARVSAEAKRRGVTQVKGYRGVAYDITRTAERFSDKGRLGPGDMEKVAALTLALSYPAKGITLEKLRRNKGVMRYTGVSPTGSGMMWCGTSDYKIDEPLVAFGDMVIKKKAWPTATGRQQFYHDHHLFREVGEELPVHKEPPLAGGNYPLTLTGGHTRWSIHSTWRDLDVLLRLQRGEPVIFINPDDARSRNIGDHDYVGVHNDLGEFVVRAKLSQSIRPGQVHMYHAWLSQQFLTGKSHDAICPSPLKITKFVGNYGHLIQRTIFEPTQTDRDTRVDIRKYTAGNA